MSRRVGDILIVAPNWLGDVVMATALIERLHQLRTETGPEAFGITLALRRGWLPLFENDPRLDRILPVERPGRHDGPRGVFTLARDWGRDDFSAALLLPPSLRVALAASLAGIPKRIGHRGDGRDYLLSDSLGRGARGDRHYADEMLDVGRAWARDVADMPWTERPASLPRLPAVDSIAAAGDAPRAPLWIVAVGASYGDAKNWPTGHLAAFLERAVATEGACVALLGDGAAVGQAAEVRKSTNAAWRRDLAGGAGVVDLVGRTDLRRVVALLRAATVFVGGDSGLMHLAAALGVPTIGLFGSSDPRWTAPRGPVTSALVADGFSCRPCFRKRCDQKSFCLAQISPERVGEEVGRLLRAQAAEVSP